MKLVAHLLDHKGREVWWIHPTASVYEALQLMADKNIGALLVLEGDRPVGIFSERDLARKVALAGREPGTTPVQEIMTTRVVGVGPEDTVDQCMALMTNRRVRHLPVVEDGRVVGIVSIGDVVKAVIDSQEEIIQQLERYITS
jgi:CBS domain-containing protein